MSNAVCNSEGNHAVNEKDIRMLKDIVTKLGLNLKESMFCYKTIVGVDCGHGDFW